MSKIDDLKKWFGNLGKFCNEGNYHRYFGEEKAGKIPCGQKVKFVLNTAVNRYTITAVDRGDDSEGYLGCTASKRSWAVGESWHRGSDLSDGPFTHETWMKIMGDIVSYEAVEIPDPLQKSTQVFPCVCPSIGDELNMDVTEVEDKDKDKEVEND